jgi:acetyl esterase/lipase
VSEDSSILTRPSPPPDAVVQLGDQAENVADVRLGRERADTRPLVVMIHGGFWRPEYDRSHVGPMAAALASAGWTVAAVEYRRIPGDPQATFDDVRLAVGALAGRTGRHDGRVILAGHSAGGHLALWAAAACPPVDLVGTLALAPVADLVLANRLRLDGDAVEAFLGGPPESSPAADPAQAPPPSGPTRLVHGARDRIVPLEISRSYVSAHPAAHLVELEGAGHFALIDPLSAAWREVVRSLRTLSP